MNNNKNKNKDKDQLITKTTVLNTYHIKPDALTELEYKEVPNPYSKKAASMKLYKKQDVINLFCDIYDIDKKDKSAFNATLHDLDLEKEIKQEKLAQKREINNEKKRQKRTDELTEALNARGLELRNDSKLCHNYINGIITISVKDITERMCRMKYLFEYKNVESYIREAKHIKSRYENVIDAAGRLAMDGDDYPDVYPWEVM